MLKKIPNTTIIKIACNILNIKLSDLLSTSRKRHLVYARFLLVGVFGENKNLSLNQIKMLLNKKDHTTILHAQRQYRILLENNVEFRNNYNAIMGGLNYDYNNQHNQI